MNARALERQSLEDSLRYAIERQELVLHYQPKFSLVTGGIIGTEALIRWNHPQRGLVFPGQFLTIAEECGLYRTDWPVGAARSLPPGVRLEHLRWGRRQAWR